MTCEKGVTTQHNVRDTHTNIAVSAQPWEVKQRSPPQKKSCSSSSFFRAEKTEQKHAKNGWENKYAKFGFQKAGMSNVKSR